MNIHLIITAAALVASASVVSAQSGPPAGERPLPAAISMTCKTGQGGGEFDVLFDKDDKTLSFVPGERLPSAEHRFAHGLLIIHAKQGDIEYSARIAERPFVTIRDNRRLDIFPCYKVNISREQAPVMEVNSGWRG